MITLCKFVSHISLFNFLAVSAQLTREDFEYVEPDIVPTLLRRYKEGGVSWGNLQKINARQISCFDS